MLDRTFLHLPGYSYRRERRLWTRGVLTWDDFLARFSESRFHKLHCTIMESSRDALKHSNGNYFGDTLPKEEAWRAFPHFRKIAYLDIETTGLGHQKDHVTVVGVYDGKDTHSFIYGKNLDEFAEHIAAYDMVVTFNGSMFDIPFLKKKTPDMKIPRLHADLRFILASLNVRGGLKKIEEQFGFEREDDLKGLNGYDAVLLWREYSKRKDEEALDKLVRYNAADIGNLKKLMEWAYKEKKGRTGFDEISSVSN